MDITTSGHSLSRSLSRGELPRSDIRAQREVHRPLLNRAEKDKKCLVQLSKHDINPFGGRPGLVSRTATLGSSKLNSTVSARPSQRKLTAEITWANAQPPLTLSADELDNNSGNEQMVSQLNQLSLGRGEETSTQHKHEFMQKALGSMWVENEVDEKKEMIEKEQIKIKRKEKFGASVLTVDEDSAKEKYVENQGAEGNEKFDKEKREEEPCAGELVPEESLSEHGLLESSVPTPAHANDRITWGRLTESVDRIVLQPETRDSERERGVAFNDVAISNGSTNGSSKEMTSAALKPAFPTRRIPINATSASVERATSLRKTVSSLGQRQKAARRSTSMKAVKSSTRTSTPTTSVLKNHSGPSATRGIPNHGNGNGNASGRKSVAFAADTKGHETNQQRMKNAPPQLQRASTAPTRSLQMTRSEFMPPKKGDCYYRAAQAILNADYFLVAAGAGLSADSGLPVYRDIASVPAYGKMGVTYADLCDPDWMKKDLSVFYGFWGSCYNSYMDTVPHEGYLILRKWRDMLFATKEPPPKLTATERRMRRMDSLSSSAMKETKKVKAEFEHWSNPTVPSDGRRSVLSSLCADDWETVLSEIQSKDESSSDVDPDEKDSEDSAESEIEQSVSRVFVYTSNVDTAFRRVGFLAGEIFEIHGHILEWQCCVPCSKKTFFMDPHFRFEINRDTMKAPSVKSSADPRGSHILLPKQIQKKSSQSLFEEDFGDDSDGESPCNGYNWHGNRNPFKSIPLPARAPPHRSNYPACPHCGRPARPSILMFDDGHWVWPSDSPYTKWLKGVRRRMKDKQQMLTLIELGCGKRIPTVRQEMERIIKRNHARGCQLIRINPDFPENKVTPSATISIRNGALDSLRKIDYALQELLKENRRLAVK